MDNGPKTYRNHPVRESLVFSDEVLQAMLEKGAHDLHVKDIDKYQRKPYSVVASHMFAAYLVPKKPDEKHDDVYARKPLEKKRGSVSLADLRRANKGELPDVDFEIVSYTDLFFQN